MRNAFFAVGLTFFLIGTCLPARAQKTEAGLIAAWEQTQKSNPKTTTFEKIKDREYHFATKQFPFDGTLLVRNVVIDDYPQTGSASVSRGTVEVELQGTDEQFHRTYAVSYAQWNQENTLYWTNKSGRWLPSKSYFEQVRADLPSRGAIWPLLVGFEWTGFLALLVALVIFSMWRNGRRMKIINQRSEVTVQRSERNLQIAERNLQLQEENTKIFREILDQLKKNSAARS